MGWNNKRQYYRNRKYDSKTALTGYVVCSLMFVVFTTTYLAVFQRDVLEALHTSMARGNTEFKILPAALVVLVILMILKWGLNLLIRLRGRAHALAYLPSFMGLVALTGFGSDVHTQDMSYVWWWLMPALTAVYVTLVTLAGKIKRTAETEKPDMVQTVVWNVGLMTVMSLATVGLGNTDRYFHNELRMERLMAEGKDEEAMRVAEKSLRTSRRMTALRMMAMTRAGMAGEAVFRFPQYYKEEGLFFGNDTTKVQRYRNDSIYAMLGGKPEPGESRMGYLKRMAEAEDSCTYARTYCLTGLMLEKDLEGFASALKKFGIAGDSLQRYYKEAAILYKSVNPQWKYEITDKDSVCHKERQRYLDRKNDGFKSEMEERNIMRKEFGDTFWWYYDYQE